NPIFIILFGSFAKGTKKEKSDLDLAYFSEEKLSSYEKLLLATDLSCMAGWEVDLIDIKQVDTVFKMQISSQGVPLLIENKNEYIHQRMLAYSMYVTLNEQRAPIIKEIK